METEQQIEETKIKTEVEELVFGFALSFEGEPQVKDLCGAIIAVAQNISIAALQKDSIEKAVVGAKEHNTTKFGIRGHLTKEGIEVTISPIKQKSVIETASPGALKDLNRQQRRQALRSLK